jgi:hypothetical protein
MGWTTKIPFPLEAGITVFTVAYSPALHNVYPADIGYSSCKMRRLERKVLQSIPFNELVRM